jgi:hypothetical protein
LEGPGIEKLVYSLSIWKKLHSAVWYIFGHVVIWWQFGSFPPPFGTLCREKSGNPADNLKHFSWLVVLENF